jgi:cell division protein FtsZ
MGVGEDETLGDAIAVTIIATGFDIEQQNGIVNTEPKKIIHTLEDEQKVLQSINTTVPSFDLNADKSVSNLMIEFFALLEEDERKICPCTAANSSLA